MTRRARARSEPLESRIRSGVAWKAASQITLQVSRMVVALVLARLLAPEDWGLAAMVFVFSGFVVVFTDNALGTALIQRRELHEGRPLDRLLDQRRGRARARARRASGSRAPSPTSTASRRSSRCSSAVSVGFLVSALGTTHMALLARDMQFRRLELRQIAATLVGAVAGITIALEGLRPLGDRRPAARGGRRVDGAPLVADCPGAPRCAFSVASLRRLGGFAGNVFGENLLYQAGRNLGTLLIGRFVGAVALGAYALATNVILVPFSRIAGAAAAGLLPRVLAHGRRPRADGRRLDPRDPARRRDRDPGARRPGHRRARLRPGRARATLGPRDAGDPDPRVGRPDPGAPDPERRGPPGARPGGNAAAVHGALVRRQPSERVALGPALGHRRRGRLLPPLPRRWSSRCGRTSRRGRSGSRSWRFPRALFRRRAGDGRDGRRPRAARGWRWSRRASRPLRGSRSSWCSAPPSTRAPASCARPR